MKLRHRITIGVAALILALLALDVVVYHLDERWYSRLHDDLPPGTPVHDLRTYLVDEGQQHGIKGLWEDDRPEMPGFVFYNHNSSVVTRSIVDGIDWLLFGYIRINLDEKDELKDMYILK